jgi:rod shape determining protein RodA
MVSYKNLGKTIWIFALSIMGIGLATLYSASYNNIRASREIFFDQMWCALIAIVVMYLLSRLDYRKFFDIAYVLYGINVVLLVLTFAIGREALGATRWMTIAGISFQPSELMKLTLILMLGRYLSQRRPRLAFTFKSTFAAIWLDLILPFILVGVPMVLIFKQPDLGTAILMMGIFVIMLFASGIEAKIFGWFIGLGLIALPFGWHILRPYQRDRLLVFLNPNIDPMGAGYTIIQSKIAIGSGGLAGKGWLSGTQNQLNFLPERHTDFIFSVIGEEWGLLGSLFVVFCYSMLIYCGFRIADSVKEKFGQYVTIGIVTILALQVVINVGMVMGMFPVVGITLPLISYGRTSFMVFAVMLGFLLNLSKKRSVF